MPIILLVLLSFITTVFPVAAQELNLVKPAVSDKLKPSVYAETGNFTGQRLNASFENRILAQDVDRLIAPFRDRSETWCWQSEFWGKWITSAILAYKYRPEDRLREVIDYAVKELISTQTPEGYIGNYRNDRRLEGWDIWGRKYCMLGLLAHYDISGDKKSLVAARRIADHLIDELAVRDELIVTKGNHKGMAASSILEPMCQLYLRTGDERYLQFAEEIVRQWETAYGPQLITKAEIDVSKRFPRPENWYGPEQGQKAYEMMSCYEGLLELYRITGRQEYKTAVEKTWQNILDTEINIAGSGASAESWFGGKNHQVSPVYHYQETCVTVTWIKLNQQLLRLTGEPKYADAIEQAYYNALLASMTPDGSDWAKYTPLSGERKEGSEQCGMGLNCCNASGPRGLFTLPLTVVMASGEGAQINFFCEGVTRVNSPDRQLVEFIQSTNYPADGNVRIKIDIPKAEEMNIQLRIPVWSENTRITVNGRNMNGVLPGKVFPVIRKWESGDIIDITLDMRGRLIKTGDVPEHLALMYGPVVLARDARLSGPVINAVITPLYNEKGYVELERVMGSHPGIWMQFSAMVGVESYTESAGDPVKTIFCDYASAGNTQDAQSNFRVWFTQLVNPRKFPENY
jgi:DUF1680 family protein